MSADTLHRLWEVQDELAAVRAELSALKADHAEQTDGYLAELQRANKSVAALRAELDQTYEKLYLWHRRAAVVEAELSAIKARHARACELLAEFDHGDPCSFDHHGNCQAHDCTNGCVVADVRAFLGGEA